MRTGTFALLLVLLGLLFLAHLAIGSVRVPLVEVFAGLFGTAKDPAHALIVGGVRLPQALTAMLAGAGLATSGLLMQTLFRNPLAGPSVLGIGSGAGLAVAVVMLAGPFWRSWGLPADLVIEGAAIAGAFAVLAIILFADRRVQDGITLLIVGLMLGYLCAALVSFLEVASDSAALKGFVLWGMGSFAQVTTERLHWLAVPVLVGTLAALRLVKPLNALLLGEAYAHSLGTRVNRLRTGLILITGVLAGTVTAFCGPIAFLGLATPHVARALLGTGDHTRLLPATLLMGAVLALACDLVVRWPGLAGRVPLNAVTSLLGAPVVVWVLLRGRNWVRGT